MSYSEISIRNNCRFCDNILTDVINLGKNYPLAGGFLRNEAEFIDEKVYPLSIALCSNCTHLQCKEIINNDILFKKGYFYYSSMIPMLVKHFEEYANTIEKLFTDPTNITIIEMGCNDGVFLRPLSKKGFKVIGVDPSDTVKKCIDEGYNIYNTYFNLETANKICNEHGECDVFLSVSELFIKDAKSIIYLINA
jgi:hypothetical protein